MSSQRQSDNPDSLLIDALITSMRMYFLTHVTASATAVRSPQQAADMAVEALKIVEAGALHD
jgi:hypothetical protein